MVRKIVKGLWWKAIVRGTQSKCRKLRILENNVVKQHAFCMQCIMCHPILVEGLRMLHIYDIYGILPIYTNTTNINY